MITVSNATKYSVKGEMAYQLAYSDGTSVRAVESKGNIIRMEYKKENGEWAQSGKTYVIQHNRQRNAERIKAEVTEFLSN